MAISTAHLLSLATGLHEEFGRVTLKDQVNYFAAHELTHLRQIALRAY